METIKNMIGNFLGSDNSTSVADHLDRAEDQGRAAFDHVSDASSEIKQGFGEEKDRQMSLTRADTDFVEPPEGFSGEVDAVPESTMDAVKSTFSAIVEKTKEITGISSLPTDTTHEEAAKEEGKAAFGHVREAADETKLAAHDKAHDLRETAAEKKDQLFEKAQETKASADATTENLQQKAVDAKDAAFAKGIDLKDTTTSKAVEYRDSALQKGVELRDNATTKAEEFKDAAFEKGSQLSDSAQQSFNNLDGMKQTISDKAVQTKDAATGALASAYASTKDTLSNAYNNMGTTSSDSPVVPTPLEGFSAEPILGSSSTTLPTETIKSPEAPREGFQGEIDQETIALDAPHDNAAVAIKEKLGVPLSQEQRSA